MEQLWVVLLALATTLFSSSISGSVLHGVAGGQGYLELIPHELIYPSFNSPVVLSQLHGLRIDEALAAHEIGQQQSPSPVDETLAVNGNEQKLSPAPAVENSVEISNKFITQGELLEQIFSRSSGSSEDSNAIEEGVTSTGVEAVKTSAVQSEIQASPTVADLLVPQSRSEASSVPSSVSSIPEQESPSHLEAIPKSSVGEVYINAEEGKLQMQASLLSSGEGPKVFIGDITKINGGSDAVPVIVPELLASGITKESKPHIITNVNVNVNVNGDGTGSVINSTSVSEITTPIKNPHKKCD